MIANNQAWGIEKTDQQQRFGGRTSCPERWPGPALAKWQRAEEQRE